MDIAAVRLDNVFRMLSASPPANEPPGALCTPPVMRFTGVFGGFVAPSEGVVGRLTDLCAGGGVEVVVIAVVAVRFVCIGGAMGSGGAGRWTRPGAGGRGAAAMGTGGAGGNPEDGGLLDFGDGTPRGFFPIGRGGAAGGPLPAGRGETSVERTILRAGGAVSPGVGGAAGGEGSACAAEGAG